MASTASHEGRSSALGDHIMVVGLSLQVLTLAIFMVRTELFPLSSNMLTQIRESAQTSQSEP